MKGFHIVSTKRPEMIARLARGDVNMPNFDGFPIQVQTAEAQFEAAVYELLSPELAIRTSRLLYFRIPVQHPGPRLTMPRDLSGRRLFVFEKSEGVNNVWTDLTAADKVRTTDFLEEGGCAKSLTT